VIVYTGHRRFEDLYIRRAGMQGHYTNSYTTFFTVTREKGRITFDGVMTFRPEEVDTISGQLWEVLSRYFEKRELPPMTDRFHKEGDEPGIVCYVPASTTYVASGFSLGPPANRSLLAARSRIITAEW